jgi:hypothetical protein
MGKIELQTDESVIAENKNFSVRSIPLDAIITNRRLILVDSQRHVLPQRNIPLAAIYQIETDENKEKDQQVTLTLRTEDGTLRQMILTLSRQAGIERRWEYDEWVRMLREQAHNTISGAHKNHAAAHEDDAQKPACAKPGEELTCISTSQDISPAYIPYIPQSQQSPLPQKARRRFTPINIAAIVVVVLVIIGAVVVFGQMTKGKGTTTIGVVTVATTVVTPPPTPVPTQVIIEVTQAIIPEESPAAPQYLIPQNGTWVRVLYPGNFVGSVGVRGNFRSLNNSLEQWIPIAATEGMVEGSIEKTDGSTDNLLVEVYRDGVPVSSKRTRTPYGQIDLHYTL